MMSATTPGSAVPAVAYCILHQSNGDLLSEDYAATLKTLHARLAQEAEAFNAAQVKARKETVTREAEVLFGTLSQFLETPMHDDQAQVRATLNDALARLADALQSPSTPRIRVSNDGRLVVPPLASRTLQQVAGRSKSYLRELGFRADSAGEIFESQFIVDNGAGLDLLEQLVRDRLGIYEAPHGKHLEQSSAFTFSAYNRLVMTGEEQPRVPFPLELCLHMSKPAGTRYAQFRTEVTGVLEAALDSTVQASVWQRKLGLGRGKEFIIRFHGTGLPALESAAEKFLDGLKAPSTAPGTDDSTVLLLKEMLF